MKDWGKEREGRDEDGREKRRARRRSGAITGWRGGLQKGKEGSMLSGHEQQVLGRG